MGTNASAASKRNAGRERAKGEPCPGCQQRLPIRAKQPDEVTTHWECTRCRSPLTGVLLKKAVPLMAARIQLNQKHFDTTGLPAIPATLRELVRDFLNRRANQNQPADERRKSARVPQQLDVIVTPLNEEWSPQGKPVLGIVVDLSAGGMGMITTAAVGSPHVVAQIVHGTGFVQLLGRVVWSQDLDHGFHNAGVQFVARFGRGKSFGERSSPANGSD
jgi:PilZ domain